MSSPASSIDTPTLTGDSHRYPGVRSFQEPDHLKFFGRRRAADELLLRVLSVRLLLQFAPSGAGKTSLLNAGLFPRLRPHGHFPFMIRLNHAQESLTQSTIRSLNAAAASLHLKDPEIPSRAEDLWTLLSSVQLWTPDLQPLAPVLVFDQFEEVFTLRDDAFRRNFAAEIGELSRGRRHGAGAAESSPPDVKIIISLREEYLGALEEMTGAIPELFRERLRLMPLTAQEAREAIVEPARLGGEWQSPPFEFEPACVDGLIDFIDGASERVKIIEPLTLQLVCQRAEEIATARSKADARPRLTLADFGAEDGLERLVHSYYKTQLEKLPDRATRRGAAAMFEHGLLDSTGKRLMLQQDKIKRKYGLNDAALAQLVESRLLRREPRHESIFYEISHDRLTEVIARHRSARLPGWVRHALVIAALIILVLAGAIVKIESAKEQTERATENADRAMKREQSAQESADRAIRQEKDAKESAARALRDAQAAKGRADLALNQAQAAKERADRALEDAQAAKERADRAIKDEHAAKENTDLARRQEQVAKDNADRASQEARAAMEKADRALQEEQTARGRLAEARRVLFGDVLATRLRDAGLSDALQQVLKAAPKDKETDPLARALELRRHGDLAWERGKLPEADRNFTEALNAITGVTASGDRGVELRAGRAQIQRRRGDIMKERGEVSKAEALYSESVHLWDEVLAAADTPENQLNAAEARADLGDILADMEDPRAEATFAEAANRALRALKEAHDRPPAEGSDSAFDLGRALHVYSAAGLGLAQLSRSEAEYKGARALAREMLRLRPLSAQARVQYGTASAVYAGSLVGNAAEWQRMQRLFEESRQQFREVTQFDPSNRRMLRDLAAVQLLLAQVIGLCANNPECKKGMPAGQLESAKFWALDASGRVHQLAGENSDSRSLQSDIAWGLEVQANLMSAQGTPAAALTVLDDALRRIRTAIVDPRDVYKNRQMIGLLDAKAQLLTDTGRHEEALRVLDESLAATDRLGHQLQRHKADNMTLRANLFRKMGRAAESAALTASADELYRADQSVTTERSSRGRDRNREANMMFASAGKASGAAKSLEYDRAAEKFREAIHHNPFDRGIWARLESACSNSAIALADIPKPNKEQEARREAALRCALNSSWMAWVLSDDVGPAAEDRTPRLKKLYEERRELAKFLRKDVDRVGEALKLADQGVRDWVTLERTQSPSPDTLSLLADAYYGLGMMREESTEGGWEDAFRSAIAYGERLRDREPANPAHRTWLGNVRIELGKRLAEHGQGFADHERKLGLQSCEEALRLAKKDDEKQDARACIDAGKP